MVGFEWFLTKETIMKKKIKTSKKDYPQRLRRIVARVEVDGKEVEMEIIVAFFLFAPIFERDTR